MEQGRRQAGLRGEGGLAPSLTHRLLSAALGPRSGLGRDTSPQTGSAGPGSGIPQSGRNRTPPATGRAGQAPTGKPTERDQDTRSEPVGSRSGLAPARQTPVAPARALTGTLGPGQPPPAEAGPREVTCAGHGHSVHGTPTATVPTHPQSPSPGPPALAHLPPLLSADAGRAHGGHPQTARLRPEAPQPSRWARAPRALGTAAAPGREGPASAGTSRAGGRSRGRDAFSPRDSRAVPSAGPGHWAGVPWPGPDPRGGGPSGGLGVRG